MGVFRDQPCPGHGSRKVYDHEFRSLRCVFCGHRVETFGVAPVATRKLPPWRWLPELRQRKWAVSTAGRYRLTDPSAASTDSS